MYCYVVGIYANDNSVNNFFLFEHRAALPGMVKKEVIY